MHEELSNLATLQCYFWFLQPRFALRQGGGGWTVNTFTCMSFDLKGEYEVISFQILRFENL